MKKNEPPTSGCTRTRCRAAVSRALTHVPHGNPTTQEEAATAVRTYLHHGCGYAWHPHVHWRSRAEPRAGCVSPFDLPCRLARLHRREDLPAQEDASRAMTSAAGPGQPLCFATGLAGACGSLVRHSTGTPVPLPRTRLPDSNHHCPSNANPLRAVEYASPTRTSAAQPARQAPPNPGLSRWLLPLVPVRTSPRFATTNARRETNAR